VTRSGPVPEPGAGDALAYLGQRAIPYGDFLSWLKVGAGPQADLIRRDPSSRGQAIHQFLDLQVLAAKGRREKLEQTQAFKRLFAALEQQCYAMTLLDEDRPGGDGWKLREQAEHPTGPEILAYFQANSERYAIPEEFTARHIMVAVKGAPGAGDRGLPDAQAMAKIALIQAELKSGKAFAELAREYSDDPDSKLNGGLYQDTPFGHFPKEFEAAVRTQEIGKVGDPVKTRFGWHLILVEGRKPGVPAQFERVKDALLTQMIAERKERMTLAFMEQARKEVGFRPSDRMAWQDHLDMLMQQSLNGSSGQ